MRALLYRINKLAIPKNIFYTEFYENPLTIQELFLTEYEFSGFIEEGTIGMKKSLPGFCVAPSHHCLLSI